MDYAHGQQLGSASTYCYIGEWVGPGNRIVVNYPEDQWVLTGVRSLETGAEATNGQLHTWAERLKVSPCPFWIVRSGLDELIAAQATWTGIEGWAPRWSDGFRVKVKTSEYLDLHRLIMDLTPKRIHEALIAGTYESYLTYLPEEHREKAEQMARDILRISNTRTAESSRGVCRPRSAPGREPQGLRPRSPEVS